jgi:hypothetical protein
MASRWLAIYARHDGTEVSFEIVTDQFGRSVLAIPDRLSTTGSRLLHFDTAFSDLDGNGYVYLRSERVPEPEEAGPTPYDNREQSEQAKAVAKREPSKFNYSNTMWGVWHVLRQRQTPNWQNENVRNYYFECVHCRKQREWIDQTTLDDFRFEREVPPPCPDCDAKN